MATIAAYARRLSDAVNRINYAVVIIGERVGIEPKKLSKSNTPENERMFQMEAIADMLEAILDASADNAPVEDATKEDKPKRGRKAKASE